MFTALSPLQILVIILATAGFYGLILAFVYGKRHWTAAKAISASDLSGGTVSIIGAALTPPVPAFPLSANSPAALPGNDEQDPEEPPVDYSIPDEELPWPEEQQVTLLKEAELVVEQIQQVVDNIQSRPANPEEVFTKLHAIVSDYSFFFDTEYYDAINRFIAVTVHRDCDLELAQEDIHALWYAAAA